MHSNKLFQPFFLLPLVLRMHSTCTWQSQPRALLLAFILLPHRYLPYRLREFHSRTYMDVLLTLPQQIHSLLILASQLLPAGSFAREPAGPKIALHFPPLSVCLSVRPHLSRAQYYVMRYYATAVYYCTNRFWRLVGQDTAIDLCCLDGEKVVGSPDNPVFATYSC